MSEISDYLDDYNVSDFELSLIEYEPPSEAIQSNNYLIEFIEKYEALPVLWNPTNPNYIIKEKRNTALDELLKIYQKIKLMAKRDDVKKKINTLRTNYRKELKLIVASKRSGCGVDEVYKPKSYVFYALQFLDKFEQPVNLNVQNVQEINEV